jgi:hypothetical protein
MYQPITSNGNEVEVFTLHPMLDAPTALHCSDCGETLAVDRCLNPDCIAAGAKASRAASTRKFERGSVSGPMLAPRAWTMGGRVD